MTFFRSRFVAAAFGLLLTSACAHQKPDRSVEFEPMQITPEPTGPDALEVYDAETLYARGVDLMQGEGSVEAAEYFQRIIDEFPDSDRYQQSLFNLAVVMIHAERGGEALAAIDQYLSAYPDEAPESEGHRNGYFRRGQALALMTRYAEAADLYDWLITLPLDTPDMVEALVNAGVSHFMNEDRITSEYRFMKARRLYKKAAKLERLRLKYFIGQTAFYLAELSRLEFSEFKLKYPSSKELKGDTTLEGVMGKQLEEKCQLLLRAQYGYTRTVREGHRGWASAAGFKVGDMYEELHRELSTMPVPDDLSPSAQDLFSQMLDDRILILLEKALSVWQSTTEMAVRTEENNMWIDKTRESLERLRAVVLDKKVAREKRKAGKKEDDLSNDA